MTLFAFDTEDDGAGNFTQGAVFDGSRSPLFFDTREDMGRWIAATRGRFYTFNLEYDLVSLYWPDLLPVRMVRSNGRILSARVGVASLFDLVWAMGGVGMKFCAGLVGMEKGELDARSREYLENDVRITWAVLDRLARELEALGAGKPTGTLAGASLRVFKSFGGHVAAFPPALESTARAAYYGGRTECFDFRERVVDGFDVNSMFPAAMLEGPFPAGPYRATRELHDAHFVCARVCVPDCHVPPLPLHRERLIFPVGKFRGVWVGEELRHALGQGCTIDKLFYAWRAECEVRPFDVFCPTLFEWRRRDAFSDYYGKRTLNSLYGKLAQRGDLEHVTGFLNAQVVTVLSLPVRDYNPSWPATITARARIHLHQLLTRARRSLVYCDTDSVFVAQRDANRFLTSDTLGGLKREHTHARMKVLAPKLYRLTEAGVSSYRSRGVAESASAEFFELGRATYKKPMRLREAVRRRMTPNVWATVEKSFGADGFEKRERLPNGTTRPLRIFD